MAQSRTRSARPTRAPRKGGQTRGSSGHGIPWLWLFVLLLIGGAVLAARAVKLPHFDVLPSAQPTPVAEPARPLTSAPLNVQPTPRPAATPRPAVQPTAHSTQVAVAAAATPTRLHETIVPTHAPTGVPAATATTMAAGTTAASVPTGTAAAAVPTGVAAGANPTAGLATASPAGGMIPTATAAHAAASGAAGDVMLTFDAGADRGYAEDILDELQDEHVVASFGVTGQWAKANPELVKRMAADGHLVFNHTLDHRSFTGASDERGGLSPAQRRQELDDADAIIAPLVGHSTQPWYRLPYGDDDAHVAADVQPAGYTHKIGWTVDSLGWRGASSTDIVARCLKLAANGALYAFHVGRASQDAIALPQVIRGLREKGFTFHRVDQT